MNNDDCSSQAQNLCVKDTDPCRCLSIVNSQVLSHGDVIYLNDYQNFSSLSSCYFSVLISLRGMNNQSSIEIVVTSGVFYSSFQLNVRDFYFNLDSYTSNSPLFFCQGSLHILNVNFENPADIFLNNVLIYVGDPKGVTILNSNFSKINYIGDWSHIYIGDEIYPSPMISHVLSFTLNTSFSSQKEKISHFIRNQNLQFGIVLSNCTFADISTEGCGGAFQISQRNEKTAVPVTVANCTFIRLTARKFGGAMCIVLPALSFLHLPLSPPTETRDAVNNSTQDSNLSSLCVFNSISTITTYNTLIETDDEFETDYCVLNGIMTEGMYTGDDGEDIECHRRGVVVFIEVLLDIYLPFNRFSFDLEGLREVTKVTYPRGFSRLESHVYFHDVNPPYLWGEGTEWFPGPNLRKFRPLELLFPQFEDHLQGEMNDLDWSFYVGTPISSGGAGAETLDCVTDRSACPLLEDAVHMLHRAGCVIFVLDNAILTDAALLYTFALIEGYQRTTIEPLRNVTVYGIAKIWCTPTAALYIRHIRFILDEMDEDGAYPTDGLDGFLIADSFMYLYHVEIMAHQQHLDLFYTGVEERGKVLHEYTCVLMVVSCKAKFNDVTIYNFVYESPLSSAIWMYFADRGTRVGLIGMEVIDVDIKRLKVYNITTSGRGGGLFAFLGENNLLAMSVSEFINCTVCPDLNVEDDGSPILVDGWLGYRPVENGGAAFVIMAFSLNDLLMLPSGTGFVFKNNNIVTENLNGRLSYGRDVIIYIYDDTRITFPYLSSSASSFSSSFSSSSSSSLSFFSSSSSSSSSHSHHPSPSSSSPSFSSSHHSSSFPSSRHSSSSSHHSSSHSYHLSPASSPSSSPASSPSSSSLSSLSSSISAGEYYYPRLSGLLNTQLYRHSSPVGQPSLPGDNIIIGFYDGDENYLEYQCGSGGDDGGSGGDADDVEEEDEEEREEDEGDDSEEDEGDVVCGEESEGAVAVFHFTKKRYTIEEVLGPIVVDEIACETIVLEGDYDEPLEEKESDYVKRCLNNPMEGASCRVIYDDRGEHPLFCSPVDVVDKGWNLLNKKKVLFFCLGIVVVFC